MTAAKKPPKLCRHKATGQAYTWVDGKRRYLGEFGTEAAESKYRELLWQLRLRGGDDAPLDLTVGELVVLYLDHARGYYRKGDRPTSEVGVIELALRFLTPHRHLRAADFGPVLLAAVRDRMVGAELARSTVNGHVNRVRRMFRWAVAQQFVRADVAAALAALAPLKKGRTAAREPMPVGPVPDDRVAATVPHLPEPVRSLVEVVRHTGARVGEVVPMRVGELDLSADVWTYRPGTHKNDHRGQNRVIPLGPRAQAAVRPHLRADPDALLFPSPRTGGPYTVRGVRVAIGRACRKAGVPAWTTHQLRHTAATRIRAEFGADAAGNVLGHAGLDATAIYAERDLAVARRVAAAVG